MNTNKWTQSNVINETTGEAKQVLAIGLYGKELYQYDTIVMTQGTHTKLLFANDDTEKDPDIHTDRFETFSSDLDALFQKEVADKYHLHKGQCVLHVDLTDNNMTAVVSIQHYGDYHFIVKDYKIALKD